VLIFIPLFHRRKRNLGLPLVLRVLVNDSGTCIDTWSGSPYPGESRRSSAAAWQVMDGLVVMSEGPTEDKGHR
jgi:hypothetical protein